MNQGFCDGVPNIIGEVLPEAPIATMPDHPVGEVVFLPPNCTAEQAVQAAAGCIHLTWTFAERKLAANRLRDWLAKIPDFPIGRECGAARDYLWVRLAITGGIAMGHRTPEMPDGFF